jgi:hypothetical protein
MNWRGAVAVLALAATLPACGKSDVDRVQLETQIQRSLQDQASPRFDVGTVSCPDRLRAEKGAQTRCSITTTAGRTMTAVVTVTGTANNRLQFDLKLDPVPRS